ncbi:Peptidase S1 and S6, chymotrypsin/Hap [Oceanobacter sp. RED65]|uniref:Peptidase S1 and S6, chymotrypsin/Hap n=2 Tax=Bermanella marisrubri TaxID=207949 RepID=Q1MYN8_9GAMM|nr:Peptidase S1 and S6, chymotrypsin/Hap [Oceanobacter sp. RED65] [Bermanella marisrubri]
MGLVIASLALHFVPDKTSHQHAPVRSYANAVEMASPAVVNIYTSKTIQRRLHPLLDHPLFQRFFNRTPVPKSRIENSLGSGVIIHKDGIVLTNRHVISGADEILVALKDGRTSNARVVGSDAATDVAVLKIDLEDLPVIPFAQDASLNVGDVTLAIGNPFGVGQTVTMGIVSATGRNQLGISTYEDFIQTDAAVNPGNSGGALVNAMGELVGINTAIYSQSGGYQGISFAIPLKNAMKVAVDLLEHGEVIRGWLGLETQELSDQIKQAFGLPTELQGQVVVGVATGGPAEKAGLIEGDIVTHFNGQAAEKGTDTMRQIANLMPGDIISMRFIRDGQYRETQATLGQRK